MQINRINHFGDFCEAMKQIGFCTAGNDGRIFNLTDYYSDHIKNHTGDPDTDPWEWRIRAIDEVDFLVYGKLFYKKAGWITKEWLPLFLSVRRKGRFFDEMYYDGQISQMEKRIYDCVSQIGPIAFHDLKNTVTHKKEDLSRFNTALTSLQMKMWITVYGETRKISVSGQYYGWPVTMFSTLENKVGMDAVNKAGQISAEKAFSEIYEHIKKQNPGVEEGHVKKFILGN